LFESIFQEYTFPKLEPRELLNHGSKDARQSVPAIPEDYSNSCCILQTY